MRALILSLLVVAGCAPLPCRSRRSVGSGEATPLTFLGEGGTIIARGRRFGPGSRLGFTARFDIAPTAVMRDLRCQIHAAAHGGAESKNFIRNDVATFVPASASAPCHAP